MKIYFLNEKKKNELCAETNVKQYEKKKVKQIFKIV